MLDLELKLCNAYFSIVNSTLRTEVSAKELCEKIEVSIEEADAVLPKSPENFKNFFLKILIKKLDNDTLMQFKDDILEDNISSVYDKILECITLRFENYLPYQNALKALSNQLDLQTKNFFVLFQINQSFMSDLLDLVEGSSNRCNKITKSVALNMLFIKTLEVFLNEKKSNLDTITRYLDKYLSEIEDLGYMLRIIKK